MLKHINSEDNNKIKLINKLKSKKFRDQYMKFIIEGINLIEEAVINKADIDYVIVSDDFDNEKIMKDLAAFSVFSVDRKIFDRISDTAASQGIIAVVQKNTEVSDEYISTLKKSGNILILDRLQDPGNIGTIIRTAVAAGYRMIVSVKGTGDVYSPKVVRSTAGMIFAMPVITVEDNSKLLELVKSLGKKLVVTTPDAGRYYYDIDLSNNIALVIGNEGNGISNHLIEIADQRVTIPMLGGIESLNAAVSASILMYETVRKAI